MIIIAIFGKLRLDENHHRLFFRVFPLILEHPHHAPRPQYDSGVAVSH
ncbi:MAG: hypothetical protein RLZZ511_106 [Cyanobacteriota bacterium]|jgi:hypothetical protein